MALFRDDAGRTEKPTPFRLSEARDKGHVPLSRELVMSGTLIAGVLAVENLGGWLLDAFRAILRHGQGEGSCGQRSGPDPNRPSIVRGPPLPDPLRATFVLGGGSFIGLYRSGDHLPRLRHGVRLHRG